MSAVCIIASQEYFSGKFIELSLTEALFDFEHTRIDSDLIQFRVYLIRRAYIAP